MQENPSRRSNKERAETMRAALVSAARALFAEKGYADTGTPEIVARAGVTRGALYHHFADKADLFRTVVDAEAQAVADEIGIGARDTPSAFDALMAGAEAYFHAMATPGRVRLLLLDGPSVLGQAEMSRIDRHTGGGTLRHGLAATFENTSLEDGTLDALTDLLSAAFDRAALAIAQGESDGQYQAAIAAILRSLTR